MDNRKEKYEQEKRRVIKYLEDCIDEIKNSTSSNISLTIGRETTDVASEDGHYLVSQLNGYKVITLRWHSNE